MITISYSCTSTTYSLRTTATTTRGGSELCWSSADENNNRIPDVFEKHIHHIHLQGG